MINDFTDMKVADRRGYKHVDANDLFLEALEGDGGVIEHDYNLVCAPHWNSHIK